MSLRIGMDIGGTKTLLLAADGDHILAHRKLPHLGRISPDEIAANAIAGLDAMLAELRLTRADIAQIGAGVPGSVEKGVVLCAPNLGWENVDLGSMFRRTLGREVPILQDTRAAALGEYTMGAGKGAKLLLCVTLGTGIGCGIVADGRILDGGLGCAGEIGHFPAGDEGRRCGCGGVDCMELYASGSGIARRAKELDETIGGCEEVFARAAAGDAAMAALIADAAHRLALALASACNLLSPDVLLFSGGLSAERAYVDRVVEELRARTYRLTASRMRIGMAALGELAPAAGAAGDPRARRFP